MILLLALSASAAPLDATVLLTQAEAICAGSYIDEHTVVTAYHCVTQGGPIGLETRDGTKGKARVIRTSLRDDLAVLRVDVTAPATLPLADTSPEVLTHVFALGHPFGTAPGPGYLEGMLRWSTSDGMVSMVGERALQVTAPINPGNSGGPIVDDDGRLVGVVSRHIKGDGIGFATRVERLHALLDKPERTRLAPIGGTIDLATNIGTTSLGTLAPGLVFDLNFRDHLVVRAGGSLPLNKRWDALSSGSVTWSAYDAQLAVRQRLFEGAATARFELAGGVTYRATTEGSFTANRILFRAGDSEALPTVSAGLFTGGTGVVLTYLPTVTDNPWLFSVRVAVPGRIGMF